MFLKNCDQLKELHAEVGDLHSLEILDIRDTGIYHLPPVIGNLTALKCLRVSFRKIIESRHHFKGGLGDLISSNVIARLQSLEELGIFVDPTDGRWDQNVESIVAEIAVLKELTTLCLYFPTLKCFETFVSTSILWNGNNTWKDKRLRSFNIIVGHQQGASSTEFDVSEWSTEKRLRFSSGESFPDEILKILKQSCSLELIDHRAPNLSVFSADNLKGLEFCIIKDCCEMTSIVDGDIVSGFALQRLNELHIDRLPKLTQIWKGSIVSESLGMLTTLTLKGCHMLEVLFNEEVVQLKRLQNMQIEDCLVIKEIIKDEVRVDFGAFPKLKNLELVNLPRLSKICNNVSLKWDSLETLKIDKCMELKTFPATFRRAEKLIAIYCTQNLWNQLDWLDVKDDTKNLFQNLYKNIEGEESSAHVAGTGETASGANERILPIHETQFKSKTVPSAISSHSEVQSERVQGACTTSPAPEAVIVASTSESKDQSSSAMLGHSEVQSDRVQSERVQSARTISPTPETVVVASTSESKDPSSSALLGRSEVQSKGAQGAVTSPAQEAVAMASSSGSKDEPTSAVSGHFDDEGEKLKASNTTSLSSGQQVPASISEIMEDDWVPFPQQIGTPPPARESEIQILSFEAGEKMPSIYKMESEIVPSQTEGEREMKRGLKASAQAVSALGRSNLVAVEPVRSSHFTIKNKIPVADQSLRESVLYAKKSIKATVRKIFSHINNVRTTKIAVIGTGGIGKTTVLKALINFLNTKHIFDEVIWVTVSRYWSTAKIQNQVLRQLSLSREYSESDSQVAERLSEVLRGKKFLLILDDVWEQTDLVAVGIPVPNSENRFKILMAFRKHDVDLDKNEFKVVQVESVPKKEARELFYEHVGRIIRSSDIQSFAETIIEGCYGLPLLIIVTGRALAEENDAFKWMDASRKFSLSTTVKGYQLADVIQRLKFSFDQLKEHDVKSCFLHCALFPEDQDVNIFKFTEYCIKEGLITGAQADAKKRARYIVDVLVSASLLQVTEGGKSIKMHDLIRSLALAILSSVQRDSEFPLRQEGFQLLLSSYSRSMELLNTGSSSPSKSLGIPEGNQFLLRAGAGLTEPPWEEEWKHAKMVFLSDNELCTLPDEPNCPELLALFLQRNCSLRVIPPYFFNYMASLEVLNLSETRVESLPETLFKLGKLLVLILRDCKRLFIVPSEVGSLVCLEMLDLQGTKIKELPDEIGELANLRHLEVSFYGSINDAESVKLPIHLVSRGSLSKLGNLETLSIVLYPGDERWNEDVKYIKTEVSKLKKLSSLCFHFPEIEYVQEFLTESDPWKNKLLMEYKFVVGCDVKDISSQVPDHLEFDYNQQSRCLRFVNGENKPDEVLQILARSSAFYLDNHLDIESLSDFGVSSMNGLKFCIISECPKIKTIVHAEEVEEDVHAEEVKDAVFPLLETLSIHQLKSLICIWEGILPSGSFAQLRNLSLHGCSKLGYVFTSSMIQYLCKLEELIIIDCQGIKQIIVEEEILDPDSVAFPSLKSLTLHYLPGLVNIWRGPWPLFEHISFYCCPNLKKIGIDSRFKDVIIKAEKSWWDALEWENDQLLLHLENCSTIIFQDHL